MLIQWITVKVTFASHALKGANSRGEANQYITGQKDQYLL